MKIGQPKPIENVHGLEFRDSDLDPTKVYKVLQDDFYQGRPFLFIPDSPEVVNHAGEEVYSADGATGIPFEIEYEMGSIDTASIIGEADKEEALDFRERCNEWVGETIWCNDEEKEKHLEKVGKEINKALYA